MSAALRRPGRPVVGGRHPLRWAWLLLPPGGLCSGLVSPSPSPPTAPFPPTEAIFGKPPFASRSFAELEEKIRSDRAVEVTWGWFGGAGGGSHSVHWLSPFPPQLPSRPQLSLECRDLLGQLLERDPRKRISFECFFAHPFVDMEHIPGPESLGKAVSSRGWGLLPGTVGFQALRPLLVSPRPTWWWRQ